VASRNDQDVILLSVHPRYADAIMRGEKKFEFRKANVPCVSFVLIYSTSPTKRILGFFKVKRAHKERPEVLWNSFGKTGSISEEDFFVYYKDVDQGIALEVGQVWSFCQPLRLSAFATTPPQSFRYVDQGAWRKVKSSARLVEESEWQTHSHF
jgi:predicted transcriptional regulator